MTKPSLGRWISGPGRYGDAARLRMCLFSPPRVDQQTRGRQLDELAVEVRGARLERVRHGEAIHEGQDLVGKDAPELGLEDPV
jgi:hypothetical protein